MRTLTSAQREAFDYALGVGQPPPPPSAVARTKNARYVKLKGVNYSTREAYVVHVLGRFDKGRTRCGIRIRNVRGVQWTIEPLPGMMCLRCLACESRHKPV